MALKTVNKVWYFGLSWKPHSEEIVLKRSIIAALCAMIISVMLIGCGEEVPELSDEENEMVAEYAVGVLSKHMKSSNNRLIDVSNLEESYEEDAPLQVEVPKEEEMPEEIEAELPETETGTEENQFSSTFSDASAYSLSDLLKTDGIEIRYEGYELCSSYPTGDGGASYFAIDANSGNCLFVVHYTLINHAGSDQMIDLSGTGLRMRVNADGNGNQKFLKTMLPEDLFSYQAILGADSQSDLVAIAEIPAVNEADLGTVTITYMTNDEIVVLLAQ